MKSGEEIYKDAVKLDDIPEYENVIEINTFMALKELLIQFQNKNISKEKAAQWKNQIIGKYETNKSVYELQIGIHKKTIDNISKTEDVRSLLRHQLINKDVHSLETALKLIGLYSEEKWDI